MVEEISGGKNDRHRLDKNRKEGYPKERDQHVQRKVIWREKARRVAIKECQLNTGKQGKDTRWNLCAHMRSFVQTLRAMEVKETI